MSISYQGKVYKFQTFDELWEFYIPLLAQKPKQLSWAF